MTATELVVADGAMVACVIVALVLLIVPQTRNAGVLFAALILLYWLIFGR